MDGRQHGRGGAVKGKTTTVYRRVQLEEDEDTGEKPFTSSLQQSLRNDKREHPEPQRERSPPRRNEAHKKPEGKGTSGRQVTMTRNERSGSTESSTSSVGGTLREAIARRGDQPAPFVSSLARSASSSQDARHGGSSRGGRHVEMTRGRETQYNASARRSAPRKNSTDSVSSQRSDRSRSGRYDNGPRGREAYYNSASRRSAPRKNSTDSVSSQRSDRSRASDVSYRYVEAARAREGYSNSGRRPRKNSTDSVTSVTSVQSVKSERSRGQRWEPKGRKNGGQRGSLDESYRPDQIDKSRRLERSISDSTSVSGARSSQDARQPAQWKSSLASSLAEKPSAEPANVPFKSSLRSSAADSAPSGGSAASEEERKRQAAERLKERLEARKGASLSQLATDKPEKEDSAPRPPFQSGLLSKDKASAPTDKEDRVREFYAKLDTEDRNREAARRAAPFKSSLVSSIAAKRESMTQYSVKKIVFTLDQLRSLRSSAISRPADLRDMTIGEVFEVRDPNSAVQVSSSSRHVERSSSRKLAGKKDRRSQKGLGDSGKKDRQDRRPGRRGQPPPPPLYDGPIEPLQLSENRWVGKKKEEMSGIDAILSHVKGVLNKLTREKFAKLTEELCKIEMDTLELLRSIISVIVDKALEEPNFADVYADLCKEFHKRTSSIVWSFLRVAESTKSPTVFYWTIVKKNDDADFIGPFKSADECLADAATPSDAASTNSCDMSSAKLFVSDDHLVAICRSSDGSFYYKKRSVAELGEDEPLLGAFDSASAAMQAGVKQTSFKRLLVTRCQFEFEKWNKRSQQDESKDEHGDQRQREIETMRAKRLMLGNIRFIGELYKTDLLNQIVVQSCIFHLLGLELVKGESEQDLAGQEVRLPDEEDIEALCKLLATVGKKYDQPQRQNIMKIIIFRLVKLIDDKKLPSRSRFLITDILEMRDHLWEPRRKELQQKTLEEVRREAKQLQQQGKNAQHDNLSQRRLKSQVSSIQLARQSSNLLVRKEAVAETPSSSTEAADSNVTSPTGAEDPAKIESRIKNIIQEYVSIHDIDEAATCVRELPAVYHVDFVEQVANRAHEGKEQERTDVGNLLVSLYESGAVDATTIQAALLNAMEFLEDIKIDIPLVHQYAALLFGRLIAAGCFGLSWMVSKALSHLVECGLASLVFAEALSVIEADSDIATVARMLADEEISPASVLPRAARTEADVAKFIEKHELESYFGGEDDNDEDELEPELESKMRSTLTEYLSIKDVDEVVLCIQELEAARANCWRHFVRVSVLYSIDEKASVRVEVGNLLAQLFERDEVDVEDLEAGFEAALADYEDLRVDIPRLDAALAELWTPLFHEKEGLTIDWLHDATSHLVARGMAAELLGSLLTQFEALYGRDEVATWWREQNTSTQWCTTFSGQDSAIHARLQSWHELLAA
ncbi:hypothetical protein Poli38472_003060 [Pythium oligandrum]|uniref:MI domain-containing protein n=1 Tax=Pythium oligandrum TaxID=41045 RepID=A0A8K1FBD2_PYTOL|nr:hypothetical protein Poli38472_003060 [Pythium oligandrum]|eukprot:TMW57135.1 hypothetical protein Poli38472_003060 [Pythium oligandrum]